MGSAEVSQAVSKGIEAKRAFENAPESVTYASQVPVTALPANRAVKINHLIGRAFEVKDFGSEVSGSASDVIAKLENQALDGDGAASYAIFLKLNNCDLLSQRQAKGSVPAEDSRLIEECEGLSAEDAVSGPKWLRLAAEQGNIGAQLQYSMDSDRALGGPDALLRDPDATTEYKQRATGYLESLAAQGSVDALLMLGNAYQVGVMMPEDLVLSRAYFDAVMRIDPSLVAGSRIGGLERSMSQQQLNEALAKGEKIYGSCCR